MKSSRKSSPKKKTVTIMPKVHGDEACGKMDSNDTRLGRPTGYRPEYARQVKILAQGGMTDFEIAEFFGVSTPTIGRWRAEFEDFRNSFMLGEKAANDGVERALFELARGYRHPDVHVSNYQGNITLTPLVKHYPPNVAAAIFWLKNRSQDRWKLNPSEGDEDLPPPTRITINVENARIRDNGSEDSSDG